MFIDIHIEGITNCKILYTAKAQQYQVTYKIINK